MLALTGLERRAERLRPMAMHPELEQEARRLFEDACCGSRSVWPITPELLREPGDYRSRFYHLAHEGMWAAQERFLARVAEGGQMRPGEEALYRTAMDAIAWQMLERQLCYARRLYRENKQPDLRESNLRSVIAAARFVRERQPASMPLITDLTTFVQIGDIMTVDPQRGMTIIEVKEGHKNREVGRLASFYRQSGCERFRQVVAETESPRTVKQFERMLRQMERMTFASDVLGKGEGFDPDLAQQVRIPAPYVPMADWNVQLNSLLDEASDRGWAIDVIDGCLFLGAYSAHMRNAAPFTFLTWLDEFSEGEPSLVARLVDCVSIPLALSMFAVPTSPDRMMDMLFGRLHVCMGISIPGLVEACEKDGISVRHPKSKSERRLVHDMRGAAVKYKGQPLILERGSKMMILADGIFMRSMFHYQRPLSVINAILDNS